MKKKFFITSFKSSSNSCGQTCINESIEGIALKILSKAIEKTSKMCLKTILPLVVNSLNWFVFLQCANISYPTVYCFQIIAINTFYC